MNTLKNEPPINMILIKMILISDLLICMKKNRPFTIENKRNPTTDVALILINLPLTRNIGLDITEFIQLQNIINEIENIQLQNIINEIENIQLQNIINEHIEK